MLITKGLINIMLKYVQSIDEKTGLVKGIGQGNNEAVYIKLGMQKVDIKQSDIDGNWYLANKCPMKSEEVKEQEKRETRIAKIKAELEEIDKQSQRSSRAIALVAASAFCQPAMTYSIDGSNNTQTLPIDTLQTSVPVFNPEDVEKLTELEKQANELRKELQELEINTSKALQTAQENAEDLISDDKIPF